MPGCKSVMVFGDDSDGQYGIFVLWDSEANANAAALVTRPRLARMATLWQHNALQQLQTRMPAET